MNRIVLIITSVCVILFTLYGCRSRPDPVHQFENFRFDNTSSLESRVTLPPPLVLDYLRKLDSRPDYQPVVPGPMNREVIRSSINKLPPLTKQVLQRRLIGIYFIKNFMGNGLTDWVMDTGGNTYVFMVFNESAFTQNISELLTNKEKTCFIQDTSGTDIRIDCGTAYNGFLYIILHESAHAVDYIMRLTPYVDDTIQPYLGKVPSSTDFTRGIWNKYDTPCDRYSFTGKVFFYNIKPPRLLFSRAGDYYADLCSSPFVSLYGSMLWPEDLAELVTLYHLTEILKQPYIIKILKGGTMIQSFRPMESPRVRKRTTLMQVFYHRMNLLPGASGGGQL
jgi:hypothetical protein